MLIPGEDQRTEVISLARRAFDRACDHYRAALSVVEKYNARANHRHAILEAARALRKAPIGDSVAVKAYEEAVSHYTDPADFLPYTETYLEAHTDSLDMLTAAFDDLTAAFGRLTLADSLFHTARRYEASCKTYLSSVEAYSRAAGCAINAALEENTRSVEDDVEVVTREKLAVNSSHGTSAIARSNVLKFEESSSDNGASARQMEERARVAERKIAILFEKARTAPVNARAQRKALSPNPPPGLDPSHI